MSGPEQHIEWTSPASLWDGFNGPADAHQRRIFRTPAILRFTADTFAQQFVTMMQSEPQRLKDHLAVPEQWNGTYAEPAPLPPSRGLPAVLHRARLAAVRKLELRQASIARQLTQWNAAPQEKPLKLYQPVHQRYYLVTACLVCRTLGLPDRPLDTRAKEKVTFVIRMLQVPAGIANPDPAAYPELALVGDEWKPVVDGRSLLSGEEQHALSPLTYTERDGRQRRLFNGLIPVAKREALLGAKRPATGAPGEKAIPDERQMQLKLQVLGPWANLEDIARVAKDQTENTGGDHPDAQERAATLQRSNDQIQTVAWYILLDFANWLETNLGEVWAAINGSPAGLSDAKLAAYNALGAVTTSDSLSLRAALAGIRQHATLLESVKVVFKPENANQWPSLRFQFVRAQDSDAVLAQGKATREALESALVAALDQRVPGAPVPAPSIVAQLHAMPFVTPWFAVRCVFERPNCATLALPVVSDPSASFQLASYFDPDAPARPIRIFMPADTTPAGLRKYPKNTAVILSDVLCGQVSALRSLTFGDLIRAVLPWPLHKDISVENRPCGEPGLEFGMVCSFSIPIITICALILLMVMVKLLDIIFYWMPFFQICLPVPKFDAKQGG